MKCLNSLDGIQLFLRGHMSSRASALIHPKRTTTTLINRLPRFRGLLASIVLGVLLASLLGPSSIFQRRTSVSAFAEIISTVQSDDCSTPKSEWDLGQTACARVTGAGGERRIVWVAPDGEVADVSNGFIGTGTDSYALVTTGSLAQYGTWRVVSIDSAGQGYSAASFLVRPATVLSADLVIRKFGPVRATAGGGISYDIEIINRGPDTATSVVLSEPVPNNSTFASEAETSSTGAICGGPSPGQTGTTTCTIPSLAPNASATFTFVFTVDPGTPIDTIISNTATVTSSTNELFQGDNTATALTTVVAGAGTPACTLSCPAPITVNNNPGDPNPCVKSVTYATPTPSGGCADPDSGQIPTVVCSPPSGSDFPIGTSNVICSAGATTCSFTITVNETRAPVAPTIACPSDVTANESSPGAGSARVNYPAPTTTGNCVSVVCDPPAGALFELGTTPVTCSGTDAANISVSCSFSVTVNVSTCGIDCPGDTTVNESSPGSGSATVTYSAPTTTGSCPTVTIACNPTSGSTFPVGTTQVNCTATDQSSSVLSTCNFSVTVIGSSTCTITCPANVTATESPSGSGSATVTYPTPTSTGTCAAAPVACSPPSGSTFPIGTTTVHCTRSDPAGNVSTCSFTVTVTGGTPCVITCPANITQSSAGCGTAVTYPSPSTTGSCGDPGNPEPWSCNPPSGSIFPVGTTTVVCSTDVGTSCSFTVTISGTDATPPTIISCAPAAFALADSTCQAPVPNVTSDVEASDNCTPAGFLIVTQNPAAGTLVGTGTTTIIVTVKDANNNSATCSTTFTLFEGTPPTALCKPYTAVLDATGNVSITGANVDNGSSDNCAIASRTVTPSTFTCANKGANTVTLTVTDPSGNSASCQATVTVVDNTPPTITCPANVVVFLPLNSTDTSMVVNYPAVTATDNCPGVTVTSTPASGSVFPVGTTTVNATATDAANNSSTCSFTVTVLYNFTGFFSPVGNPPVLNVVNAGRAIPVKFSLSGNKGLDIFAPGFPVSGVINCDANAPPVEVTETVTAGSSSLTYNAGSGEYNYVWATDASWAGTCRQLVVKLNDGSQHVANFRFR